jgi:hypothetical protein
LNYTEYTTIKNKFTATPNLCDLFKLLSIETWKRIEYSYLKPRVKVFETTVTQNLIFSINAYKDQYNLNIDALEASDEKTNGNDFELIIRFPNDGIEYYAPIQAKKVYRNGRYLSMDHGAQIESLINYANANNAKPMYLLYNFASSPFRSGVTLSSPPELLGCTLISAEYLFNNHYNQRLRRNGTPTWHIPDFYDLNPANAFAWHELVCSNNVFDLYRILQKKGLVNQAQISNLSDLINVNTNLKQGFYPLNTFIQDKNWLSIRELEVPKMDFEYQEDVVQIVRDITVYENTENNEIREGTSKERIYPKFSPKSRVVLTRE